MCKLSWVCAHVGAAWFAWEREQTVPFTSGVDVVGVTRLHLLRFCPVRGSVEHHQHTKDNLKGNAVRLQFWFAVGVLQVALAPVH